MALAVRAGVCLNPHERIEFVGGPNPNGEGRWKLSQPDAIAWLKQPEHQMYVERPPGHSVDVVVEKSRFAHEYLTTRGDGESQNNLLSLPECR